MRMDGTVIITMSGNNFKPKRRKPDAAPIHVVVFRSRNKDNKGITDNDGSRAYRERSESFLTRDPMDSKWVLDRFQRFVDKGLDGETSRYYYSVNERDEREIQRQLMHALIDNDDIDMTSLDQNATSIAAHEDCKATRHILLDLDTRDEGILHEILAIIRRDEEDTGKPNPVTVRDSINGYHIICERGFKPELLNDYKNVCELKRDAYLLAGHATKHAHCEHCEHLYPL